VNIIVVAKFWRAILEKEACGQYSAIGFTGSLQSYNTFRMTRRHGKNEMGMENYRRP